MKLFCFESKIVALIPINSYYLNYSRGLFTFENSKIQGRKRFYHEWFHDNVYKIPLKRPDSYWQMRVMLFPVKKERYKLIEMFHLNSSVSLYDGFQTYLLTLPQTN